MKKKYDLKEDHKNIKKQIKERENKLDKIMRNDDCNRFISEELEAIAEEMYAINI